MPVYRYSCPECGAVFSRKLSIAEYEKSGPVRCPHCGNAKPERLFDGTGVSGKNSSSLTAAAESALHTAQSGLNDIQKCRHPAGCGCRFHNQD